MTTNVIDAILNIIKTNNFSLLDIYISNNRANSMGLALEKYIMDSFANTILENDEKIRKERYSQVFSYKGNTSNPPDAMIRDGIALEVKKIESKSNQLQLNSSYPKSKLFHDNPRLSKGAKNAESWVEKDFMYAIGFVKDNYLKELAFIDGEVYCADKEIYENNFERLKKSIVETGEFEFSKTNELGRINRIDPLGITSLRLRGMWLIDSPFTVFKDIYKEQRGDNFTLFALIPTYKYKKYENRKELEKLCSKDNCLTISDELIENPNNPVQLIECKKIVFSK